MLPSKLIKKLQTLRPFIYNNNIMEKSTEIYNFKNEYWQKGYIE